MEPNKKRKAGINEMYETGVLVENPSMAAAYFRKRMGYVNPDPQATALAGASQYGFQANWRGQTHYKTPLVAGINTGEPEGQELETEIYQRRAMNPVWPSVGTHRMDMLNPSWQANVSAYGGHAGTIEMLASGFDHPLPMANDSLEQISTNALDENKRKAEHDPLSNTYAGKKLGIEEMTMQDGSARKEYLRQAAITFLGQRGEVGKLQVERANSNPFEGGRRQGGVASIHHRQGPLHNHTTHTRTTAGLITPTIVHGGGGGPGSGGAGLPTSTPTRQGGLWSPPAPAGRTQRTSSINPHNAPYAGLAMGSGYLPAAKGRSKSFHSVDDGMQATDGNFFSSGDEIKSRGAIHGLRTVYNLEDDDDEDENSKTPFPDTHTGKSNAFISADNYNGWSEGDGQYNPGVKISYKKGKKSSSSAKKSSSSAKKSSSSAGFKKRKNTFPTDQETVSPSRTRSGLLIHHPPPARLPKRIRRQKE